MITVLSPSKKLDFTASNIKALDTPLFKNRTKQLVSILKKKSATDLKELMHISDALAELNVARYKSFGSNYTEENSKPSLMAFTGDVYLGLEAKTLNKRDINFAQKHFRILSGLYGLLKPLDAMQPYRLEMGTSLENKKGKDLYTFWGDAITKAINKDLDQQKDKTLVNLASKEYFQSLDRNKIKGDVVDIHFREYRNGQLKFLSFNAKKARGFMSRYIIENRIDTKEELKGFNVENYYFDEKLSASDSFTFVR
ncbi:MAG: peroxide stress protein YaaA [Saprospiraceae bacterium]|nr:peroxide stress protein YaaA [Saprospiraceae bacterium]